MRLMKAVPIMMMTLVLAACGSSSTSTGTTAADASPASAPMASVVPVAPIGEVTCDDFDVAGANLRSYVHYASLSVGTTNDTAPTYGEMAVALGIMQAGAATCAPDAIEEIDALTVAAQDAAASFQPTTDAAAITAQKDALTALKDAGAVAWSAMGKDPADWDTTLRFTE
jgi:hypothetical protein